MKKHLLFLVFSFLLLARVQAQADHVVISQVYGAGGNSGALFKYDFVELFNPTSSIVDLTGWSLQYASAGSSNWSSNKVDLSGSVAPGKYFLIQLNGGVNGNNLPTPDLISTNITLSASAGKVALVSNAVSLTGECPASASIIDRVGYGSTSDCSEAANAPATTVSLAIFRINNGCTDDNNNFSDFMQMAPSPRNSSSPANLCNGSGISISAISNTPFCVDGSNGANAVVQYIATGTFQNSNFSVYLSDVNGSFTSASVVGSAIVSGTNPSGSITIAVPASSLSGLNYRLRINADNPSLTGNQSAALEVINGAKNLSGFSSLPDAVQITLNWTNPIGCFDELIIVAKEGGSVTGLPNGNGAVYTADLNFAGNGTSFGGGKIVYKGTASGQVVTGLVKGSRYYFKAFTRRGTQWSNGIEINDLTRYLPQAGDIVINQFSPDYGAASDEYVELVNTTNKSFDLSDVQFAYQSSTGGSKVKDDLQGELLPHSYWLLSAKASITVGKTAALNRDGSINDGFALSGQVAILRKADNGIIDALAYGNVTAGDYIESSPAANAPTDGGLKRITDGLDQNTNNADLVSVNNSDIDLRNSSSRLANAGAQIQSGNYSRIYLSGNAALSGTITLSEKIVLVNGILSLGNYNLTTTETEGGNPNSYIRTNASGFFTINNIVSAPKKFPVGNSTWNPLTINNGGGHNWSVRVEDGVQGVINNNKLVLRSWHITPSVTPITGATVTFEYNDGDVNQVGSNFNKNEDVQVWNYHDNRWQSAGLAITPTGLGGGNRTVTLGNWTEFSPFALANMTGPLPIRFYDEKAEIKNYSIHVSWTNLTEENVKHYEVERSSDGINFLKIGITSARKNNGGNAEYVFVDNNLPSGKVYYRIKAVEEDGKIIFSRIISTIVNNQSTSSFLIYPNPVKNSVLRFDMRNLPIGKYQLRIYNFAGQVVQLEDMQNTIGTQNKILFLNKLKPGYYILDVSGEIRMQQKFTVE